MFRSSARCRMYFPMGRATPVRALLRKLLDKGHVAYRADRGRYVYRRC